MSRSPASFSKLLLPGSRVLVTGASGGIGHALVSALLDQPAVTQVIAGSRAPEQAPALKHLAAQEPQRVQLLPIDVSDEASVAQAAARLAATGARLDLLINCAGLLHAPGLRPERRLEDVRADGLMRSFAVNALGPLLLARHFIPALTQPRQTVFASLSARVGSIGDNRSGGWYAYRASKAAHNQILRCVAIEAARRAPHLLCVALHPGTVDTALSKPFQAGVAPGKLFTPERAAAQLLGVLDQLRPGDSGRFLAWDGQEIPW